MAEKDWRTVTKSLYILHRVGIAADPELHREFLKRYFALRRTLHKKSRSLYYSSTKIAEAKGEETLFLKTYSAFVLDRFTHFSGRFEEQVNKPPSL